MAEHEPEVGAQVGELLPAVARHLRQERALAVHHLVVGQRQDEVLGEGVDQAEGQLVVVIFAMDGVLADVVQRVVHPAHVPFVAEAEAAEIDGPRDAGPGGRFFGDRGRALDVAVGELVEPAQQRDRGQVLVAAVLVRDPLAGLARVVEIKHRGDRIDPEPVDVVVLEPEQRVGEQEVRDLAPTVIVDQRVPVEVKAEARVGVLVEMGAVEIAEPVRIGREVARHPVEHEADAGLLAAVDEADEGLGRPVPAGRREQADRLVAPGAVERDIPRPAKAPDG